jgi:hypothetical protein
VSLERIKVLAEERTPKSMISVRVEEIVEDRGNDSFSHRPVVIER